MNTRTAIALAAPVTSLASSGASFRALSSAVTLALCLALLPSTAQAETTKAETTHADTEAAPQASDAQATPFAPEPVWAFEESDIPVDPAYTFGQLDNGMRYILRSNATPEGTGLVRLHIASGSLDETETERGLAHYLEHMAFNGSTNVPEGEMVKLLERKGLSFGADTNASTSLETTDYKLNLPNNEPDLLDTALMLMRETASELTIAEDAVERERGVILAERRDQRTFAYSNLEDQFAFGAPNARFPKRLPIGVLEVLENATADDLRGYYERIYTPANATLIVIGDFDLALMKQQVARYFADWSGGPAPVKPETGPIDITRSGETDIYTDPALSERITITRYSGWEHRPDTVATRQQNLLRQIGYAIVNRRFAALARGEDAPFRGAGFGSSDMFEDARATNLVINTEDGGWELGLVTAASELRRALEYPFSDAEVAEQIAKLRNSIATSARGASTRSHGALLAGALGLITRERVPSTPQSALERFEAYAPQITAAKVQRALLADAAPLVDPLIRFTGRTAPEGAVDALRAAWESAMTAEIAPPEAAGNVEFAYTDFGEPGVVVSDTVDERFGFRLLRFANGVRLNLKQTDIREDRISTRLTLDGGRLLNTREEPLKTALTASIPLGGLGEHSQDELESVLAGRNVRFSISAASDSFRMGGTTTPDDLGLQLQLLAAGLTDPGYRSEGEERYRRGIANFFANLDATPGAALRNNIGRIHSDGDPRFTLQSEESYNAQTYAALSQAIGDRLERGAIELALVGDIDEDAAIAAVARTLGALPPREAEFLPREEARERSFTQDRSQRILTHTGEADQALVRMTWPTTDDSDLREALRLGLLNRVVRLKLQEVLREKLGKAYSPSSTSSTSRIYRGYGTLALSASVDVAEVEATRAAIRTTLEQLRDGVIDADLVDRARTPLLERYDNLLKSLGGWMSLADRAQSEADRLDRYFTAPDILKQLTPQDLQAAAQQYLAPDDAVEILVLPEAGEDQSDDIGEDGAAN